MAYSRPSSYPYPRNLVDHKGELSPIGVKEHLEQLYKSMLENDSRGEYAKDKDTDIDLKELFVRPEWYGAKGDGVADDTVAVQHAADALTAGKILVGSGTYRTTDSIYIRKSNCEYDFRACKFTGNGTIVIGDLANPTVIPENIRIFGGEYRPDAQADVYPNASRNPIAILIGTNITLINPRVFPKQGARALSIQTDTGWGTAPYANLRRIRVYGIEIYGDGNAVDGVDVGSLGADNMIQDVYVEGFIDGCQRGVHVYSGSSVRNNDSINLDLTIRNATLDVGDIAEIKNSNIRINAINANALGLSMWQLNNSKFNLSIHGTGASLADAFYILDSAAPSNNNEFNLVATATGGNKWATGLVQHMNDAFYKSVLIDGATLGIDATADHRSMWGTVILMNCTTAVSDLTQSGDLWGEIIDAGIGVGATKIYGSNQSTMTTDVPTFKTAVLTNLTAGYIPTAGVNRVLNGDFSSDTSDWTASACTIASVAGGYSGNCLEITRVTGDQQAARQDVAGLTIGEQYVFSAWVKSGTSGDGYGLFRAQHSSDGLDPHDVWFTSSGAWTQYSVAFTPDEASYLFQLYKASATAGTMLFDSVSIVKIGLADSPLSTSGTDVDNSGAYKVAGIQIVGAQAAAQADLKADYATPDLDTEAEVIAAINATNAGFNTLLAKLRTHGVIAT